MSSIEQHITIKRRIMRRIYAMYALSVVTQPTCLAAVAFIVSLELFRETVFVARVWESLMAQTVANVPSFIISLVGQGEVLTLTAVAGLAWSAYVLLRHAVQVLSLVRMRSFSWR